MEKDTQINIRLPKSELDSLKAKAADAGMTVTAFVRVLLRNSNFEIRPYYVQKL